MQAEMPPRSGGFILSDGINKPYREFKTTENVREKREAVKTIVSATAQSLFTAFEKAFRIGKNFAHILRINTATQAKLLARGGICALFVVAFCRIYTVGTAVYCKNKRIAVTNTKSGYIETVAENPYLSSIKENFRTVPYIYPKRELCRGNAFSDKLLLSSAEYGKGYALYVGKKKIFCAESMAAAKNAATKYVNEYSFGTKPSFVSDFSVKPCVEKKSMIKTENECISLLKKSASIEVISVKSDVLLTDIPYEMQTIEDADIFIGETKTKIEGQNGTKQIKKSVTYKNGEIIEEKILSENVLKSPTNCVLLRGTKNVNIEEYGVKYPVQGKLSSPFGPRWGRNHDGIDIAVPEGTAVKAAECGTVSYVSENAGGYGKFIKIDHGYGMQTAYGHLSRIDVKNGDEVSSGQVIALSGNTGNSTGPHLHFEIIKNGEQLDPQPYLK